MAGVAPVPLKLNSSKYIFEHLVAPFKRSVLERGGNNCGKRKKMRKLEFTEIARLEVIVNGESCDKYTPTLSYLHYRFVFITQNR